MSGERIRRDFPCLSAAVPSDSDLAWLETHMAGRILARAEHHEASTPGGGLGYLANCYWG